MTRRIRNAAANGNNYFTSSIGVMKSESVDAVFTMSGMPRSLDIEISLYNTSPTLLAAGYARAYRGVWCKKDENNNLIQGSPSPRSLAINTAAGTRDVICTIYLPIDIDINCFFQLYATSIVSDGVNVDPGDECRLIYEYFPTSTDISNGYIQILDNTPDSFRGADLYSNETQLGIARSFDRPPLCTDMVWYNNSMIVANLTDLHSLSIQMIGTSGMVAAQTIVLAGITYTAGTSENTATGTFQVFKPGGGGYTDATTQTLNIYYTSQSLCRTINRYSANSLVYAYYDSGPNDRPGKIFIQARGHIDFQSAIIGSTISGFQIRTPDSGMSTSFSPVLSPTGITYESSNNRRVNQLRCSEVGQPEHMNISRNIIVGGADEEIQRILKLKSSLIIIKDRSVWRITDGSPGESPVLLDNTCGIVGRDSAAVLNNAVYFLSDQGFVCATENGVQIIGRPIENQVVYGLEAADTPDHDIYVGVGYERERFYMCSVYDPDASEVTCYKYSPISNSGRGAWTRRRLNSNAFCVSGNRLLYALKNENGHILRERKSVRDGVSWYKDYTEEENTFRITSINSTLKTVTGTFTALVDYNSYFSDYPEYGWIIRNSSNQHLVLSRSGTSPMTLTLDSVTGLSTSTNYTIYRPVPFKIEFQPISSNPLELKQFCDVLFKLETHDLYAVDVSFANNIDIKSTPAAQDWTSPPAATRVYIPSSTGAEPSSTSNDFSTTPGTLVPFNEIRTLVDPLRSYGQQLSVRVSGTVASGFIAIKGMVISVSRTGSNRIKQ